MLKNKFVNNMISNSKEISTTVTPNSTIISSGTEITCALFKAIGSVIVDGRILGSVEIDGDIIIEVNGYIEGDLTANHIVCSGDITGNVTCKEVTHLRETANVYGDITSTAIKIDEGAVFCGNCKTQAKFFQEKSIEDTNEISLEEDNKKELVNK
jgi:cytoskeletal protein CcmA (bactofilin family)